MTVLTGKRRHLLTRFAAGAAAAVAVPLAGPGVAQAALANGNPITTTLRPDLRTVHLVGTNKAEFCFDKALTNPGTGGFTTFDHFRLGGYGWETFNSAISAGLDVANQQCVIATFALSTNQSPALADYSIGLVMADAVSPNASGGVPSNGNLTDSTANLDSTSHAGTRGNTTATDLVSANPNASLNSIDFVFNKAVNTSEVDVGEFGFYDAAGTEHFGDSAVVVNGNDVQVTFLKADDVRTARRSVIEHGGAQNASGDPTSISADASLAIPGTDGATTHPALTSAALSSPGSIDFTFDQPIGTASVGAPDPTDGDVENYAAFLSNGVRVTAEQVTVIGPNTVRAKFNSSIQNFYEEFVRVSVDEGAVTGANGAESIVGGADVGGNTGAFATGFTNAPDARGVTFDKATGTVVVDFDQRVNPATIDATSFVLRAADGTNLGGPIGVPAVTQSSTPSDAFVSLQFSPQTVAGAAALEIVGDSNSFGTITGVEGDPVAPHAVETFPGVGINSDAFEAGAANAGQLIAPSAPASAFRAPGSHVHSYVRLVKHTKKHARKHSKKR